MSLASSEFSYAANPLDLIEEIVTANEWTFDRTSDDEMIVDFPGHWCGYHLHFSWHGEFSAMHFTCALDMKVPKNRLPDVYELLCLINGRLWLGHFDLSTEERLPVFRHTTLFRGSHGASVEQLEDLVDIALTECERYYPAFQFVIWSGKRSSEAIAAAMLDTMGEA